MSTFVIHVDDDDRDDAPKTPWVAILWDEAGEHIVSDESGIGATPEAAVLDLFRDLRMTGVLDPKTGVLR